MVCLIASPLAAQSKVIEKTVSLTPGGVLRLEAQRGSVRLMGWDRDQVEVRARIEPERSWRTEDARTVVEETTVDILGDGTNEVTIRGNYYKVPSLSRLFGDLIPNIHYEIRAPRRSDLRLNIDRSNSVISGFQGRMDLEADRSVIDAADITGPMRARLDRAGDSSFRNLRGSFDIQADRTNVRLDVVSLDTSSRIGIDRGDIDMSLARGQGVELSTSLSRRVSFDTNLPLQLRSSRRENPSGTINGGGPRLSIEADRSSVRLR